MTESAEDILRWRRDAVAFVRECLGVEPDDWQLDCLRYLSVPVEQGGLKRRLSMQACAGPGKSAVLAWLGLWCLFCFGDMGEHPQGVAVSMTKDNLMAGLAKEIAKWLKRSELLMRELVWTASKVYHRDHPETWFLEFRSFSKSATKEEIGETLSGLHSTTMMFYLIDEGGSIDPIIGLRAEQGMGDPTGRGLIATAGNTTSKQSFLYKARLDDDYETVSITADPDDPKRTPRVSVEHAAKQIAKAALGREDPWVQAFILGVYPESAINQLLTLEQVEAAMERVPMEHEYDWAPNVLGVDVARFGLDSSVIAWRQGLVVHDVKLLPQLDSNQGAGHVALAWQHTKADACFVDDTGGYGAGWIDRLRDLRYKPVGIAFSGKPSDPRFYNKRTEMWWEMAEWVKRGGALPKDTRLLSELVEPTYTFKGDKLLLEPKENIAERLGRSPDIADAIALTFAQPVQSQPSADERLFRKPTPTSKHSSHGIPKEWLE